MHAAIAARRIGMPCGIVACFQETSGDQLRAAVEMATRRFPILSLRVDWIASRPVLVSHPADQSINRSTKQQLFEPGCASWQYRIIQYGTDSWLTGLWPHAMADGPSMLRFLETVAAIIDQRPLADFNYPKRRQIQRQGMLGWLVPFLIDRSRRYLHVGEESLPPGVAWCKLQLGHALPSPKGGEAERASAAAWLGAAACISICEQKCLTGGRLLLNFQVQRDNLEKIGGFGFGAGSVLIPVELNTGCSLSDLACRIFDRLTSMINRGWNENFENFLSNNPQRHHLFAALHDLGRPAPIISISWKEHRWALDRYDKVQDIACFALSPTLHISGHVDWTGASLSITSKQPMNDRLDLLRRLTHRLSGAAPGHIFTFNGDEIVLVTSKISEASYNTARSILM
jgi:hypothetical protein